MRSVAARRRRDRDVFRRRLRAGDDDRACITAPVLSLLIGGGKKREAIGLSPAEISCARRRFADEGLSLIGLRFRGDPLSENQLDFQIRAPVLWSDIDFSFCRMSDFKNAQVHPLSGTGERARSP
jgi:hypothetical protein